MKYAAPVSTEALVPASTLARPRTTGRSVVRPKALENTSPGVNFATSSSEVTCRLAMSAADNAVTGNGTSCRDSSRLRAVTTTSSRVGPRASALFDWARVG